MVRTMGKNRTVSGQAVAPVRAARTRKIRGGKGRRALGRLWRDNAAVTSVEYAVMLALILGVILVSIKLLGTNTKALWTNNSATLQGAGLGS
jgi:Flp pilus assembly pilin Flp